MEEKRGFWKGLVCGLVIAVLFGGIVLISKQVVGFFQIFQSSNEEVVAKTEVTTEEERVVNDESLEKIEILENMIEIYYHEEVSDEVLRQGMYEGILASLEDPYSEYYSPEEFQAIMEQTEGIYYGIGAYISTNTETGLTMISGLIPKYTGSGKRVVTR
jgi:carboxyl-terminal processing protease